MQKCFRTWWITGIGGWGSIDGIFLTHVTFQKEGVVKIEGVAKSGAVVRSAENWQPQKLVQTGEAAWTAGVACGKEPLSNVIPNF